MTLESFQTLYTVFLVLTIIFLILSIVFFFVFDIRKIFSIKTGRALRKSVQELNEINKSEDNRKRKKYKSCSMPSSNEWAGDFDKITEKLSEKMNLTDDISSEHMTLETEVLTDLTIGLFKIIEKKEVIFAKEIE